MVSPEDVPKTLLQGPSDNETYETLDRAPSAYKPLHTFRLKKDRSYQQQYGDMYFLRLAKIKPAVEAVAAEAWDGLVIGGERVKKVDRVLDVRQGQLCWVVGTVYMDMPLKPDILEDVSNDRWLAAPINTTKYYSDDGSDQVMLEDDSGRIKLVGDSLKDVPLVTGCIIAVMGTETASGELDVAGVKFADLPPQPERWSLSKPPPRKDEDVEMSDAGSPSSGTKLAIVSGLSFSGKNASHAVELDLLLEFLLGEALDPTIQKSVSQISRLIVAGNSIARDQPDEKPDRKTTQKKYGYDASAYNPAPFQLLDDFFSELLPSIPVTVMPGSDDPATAAYPQQPVHAAMFPKSRGFAAEDASKPGWFDCVTNPWEGEVDGWRVLGTGGQNVDDVFKYIGSDDRLGMMEGMCRWRCIAPTAPDTLWSYPFQEDEPFVLKSCPHLYFVGSQPRFSTRTIRGTDNQAVRLVTVPSFARTGEIVLVDTETLETEVVRIAAGMK